MGARLFIRVLRDVGIALIGIILTVLFNIATVGIVDPARFEELKKDQAKIISFLAVPFDLWIVSFSLIMGATFTLKKEDRGKLVPAILWALGMLLFVLASVQLSPVMPALYSNWLKIYVPDLVGFALIGLAAHSV